MTHIHVLLALWAAADSPPQTFSKVKQLHCLIHVGLFFIIMSHYLIHMGLLLVFMSHLLYIPKCDTNTIAFLLHVTVVMLSLTQYHTYIITYVYADGG